MKHPRRDVCCPQAPCPPPSAHILPTIALPRAGMASQALGPPPRGNGQPPSAHPAKNHDLGAGRGAMGHWEVLLIILRWGAPLNGTCWPPPHGRAARPWGTEEEGAETTQGCWGRVESRTSAGSWGAASPHLSLGPGEAPLELPFL